MSGTHRGRKRQAPTVSSNPSEANENLSVDDDMSLPGTATFDGTFSQVSKGKRRRRRFDSERRKQVANVRKVGACPECRARKVACKHALQETDAHPDSVPVPKPSPPTYSYPFEFEATYTNITYPTNISVDEPGQLPHLDETHVRDPLPNDGSHLIATVPASTARQVRIADDLHDFENVIEDKSLGSTVKIVSNSSKRGQNPQWARALMNNLLPSQPSTVYPHSNTNSSTDLGPSSSTPGSSHDDLLSAYTYTGDMGHCWSNEYGCDRLHGSRQEIHVGRHQETEYAGLYPSTRTYPCPMGCGVKPFRKLENLKQHLISGHPEISTSPTQLSPLNVFQRDAQPDRLAHLQKYSAEEYLPGMEVNPIAIADQKASGEIVDDWNLEKSLRRAQQQRVYWGSRMVRPNTPMQSQISTRTVDDHAAEFQGQFIITDSDREKPPITVTSSYASLQRPAARGQYNLDGMSNFNGLHRMSQSRPQHTNSPAPSLSGRFAQTMQISDPMHLFSASSEIEGEVPGLTMQHDHLGMFMTPEAVPLPTSPPLGTDWDPQSRPANGFSPHTLNSYGNLGYRQTEGNFQPGNDDSNMSVPAWAGQGPSNSRAETDGFSSGLPPPDFQVDTQGTHYLVDDGSSQSYHIPPGTANNPMFKPNDRIMLHTGQDADLTFAPNTYSSNPILSQSNSLPRLVYSTFSSSRASENLVSPVDAPNRFSDKPGEDWDVYDLNHMDMYTNDEVM